MESAFPVTTQSVEETMDLGADLAARLDPGAVVAIDGDLGAGKTHFVKGLARGLGYSEREVRSPTFTIVQVHEGGSMPLYHFDAYRVGSPEEFVDLGFEEYVYGEGVTVVEWPRRVEDLLPDDTIWLRLEHISAEERRISKGR
ncbi:tRNA (adenosine(37)-N6)-threonylcarbamoyltransferase complex ATPase subunit type 1 TsaE [Longibacter salinarum]|uniref:tRNA threonylcarbamoyladenosine biosynthesis protein TsaE n=1 Tax=Longibacter salinarum TaxID=1850348 RepID=A0A2A8CWI8_9BACT|nr:tRNA (adenosine(37)-N6)-threonylcarbamoyltransferase complex ATPase subunit type 1 TsaE [Longibacter salinarum]PEN13062.1 tRNA (adenosine(37)-N6)-threonylcarbamoyltransferase complex ATPase subunit type 1 TsaE [Longibacter salinarum]